MQDLPEDKLAELPAEQHEPRWRRRKEDRPREIMEAALAIFLEKGFSTTRLEDVAAKANVTKGTLFIYFKNKEDLFRSLIIDSINKMSLFKEASQLSVDATAQETLVFMTNNWWKFLANSDFGKLPKLIVSEAANFPDMTTLYLEQVLVPGRAIVTEVIRKGIESGEFIKVDPELAARVLLAPLLMHLIWRYSVAPFEKKPTNEIEFLKTNIKITIQGLLARPEK